MSRLKKHLNADIIAILRPVMERNTILYQNDFCWDIELFIKAASSPDEEDKYLFWMSRTCGTEITATHDIEGFSRRLDNLLVSALSLLRFMLEWM